MRNVPAAGERADGFGGTAAVGVAIPAPARLRSRCFLLGAAAATTAPLLAAALAVPAHAVVTRSGPEFRVNETTTGDQFAPEVARLADGSYLVVWHSAGDLFARRMSSAGGFLGTEFQLNTYTTGSQHAVELAVDADGNILGVWMSQDQDGSSSGVFARRLTSEAALAGTEFQVNSYTTSFQVHPTVGALPDGRFVVAWSGYGSATDSYDVHQNGVDARFFNSDGSASGTEFRVSAEGQYYPYPIDNVELAVRTDGRFIVAWGECDSDCDEIDGRARVLDSTGSPVSSIASPSGFLGPTTALATDDGTFVVAGHGTEIDFYQNVRVHRFDGDGQSLGGFVANTYTTDSQAYAAAAPRGDNGFVVAWTSAPSADYAYAEQDGDKSGIFAQLFDADSAPLGTEFQVNAYTTGFQDGVAVAPGAGSRFVVVWASPRADAGYEVVAQFFTGTTLDTTTSTLPPTTTPPSTTSTTSTTTTSIVAETSTTTTTSTTTAPSTSTTTVTTSTTTTSITLPPTTTTTTLPPTTTPTITSTTTTSTVTTTTVGSTCGNGNPDSQEECDDGNVTDGDGCSAACTVEQCGDANGDDAVTAIDALIALHASVGSRACFLSLCDANGDGAVTAPDALLILRVAVGIEAALVCL